MQEKDAAIQNVDADMPFQFGTPNNQGRQQAQPPKDDQKIMKITPQLDMLSQSDSSHDNNSENENSSN